jgi:hypothetical protein
MDESYPLRSRAYLFWVVPVTFLVGVWLWLAFSHGGHPAQYWAFPAVALGVAGALTAWRLGYPRRPRQLSLAVLALFAGFAVWVLASNIWAADTGLSWSATGRAFLYLLVLALGLAYFTSLTARRAFKYLLMGACLMLLVAAIWRLWTVQDMGRLFIDHRLVYPTGEADSAAALFLLCFWPLMWLAAGPRERALVRGAAVGLATGMMALALLTQSRGAAWSLAISLVFIFVLSPGRLRLLFYVVVPALLMVYAYPLLDRYWTQVPPIVTGDLAARTLTVSVLASGFIGMIVALLESWVKVSVRMKLLFGSVVLIACAAGLVYGAMTLTAAKGGPVSWFNDAWSRLAAEPATDLPATAGPGTPSPTRAQIWSTGWQDFSGRMVLGAGADQSASRTSGNPGAAGATGAGAGAATISGPLALGVLGDTGVVGGVLIAAAILLSGFGILWPRTVVGWRWVRRDRRARTYPDEDGEVPRRSDAPARRRSGPDGTLPYGWQIALVAALVFWLAQANLTGLLQVTGVTVPALLILTAALAAADARVGTLWPRVREQLRHAESDPPERTLHRLEGRLRPEGRLSQIFRVGLGVLSAAAVVLAISAYFLASL